MSNFVLVPATVLDDIENYIEQANIVLADSDRKGANVLHSMGERRLADIKYVRSAK